MPRTGGPNRHRLARDVERFEELGHREFARLTDGSPAASPYRQVHPADARPGQEHLVYGAVQPGHVAAGEPLDAPREAVPRQRPDDQFHCQCSRVDVDGCQCFAGTAFVQRLVAADEDLFIRKLIYQSE
jgi:hypothetical protein